jgi:triosephosphate isomerase
MGPRSEEIGRVLQTAGQRHGVAVALAPSTPDIARLADRLSLPILGQHVDFGPAGARTGFVVPEALRAAGARGALVNHSEHPLTVEEVGWTVGRLTGMSLTPVVCAKDAEHARVLAQFRPAYLAVEPPDLIGGQRSVSSARPEVVHDAVAAVHAVSPWTRVLCGAGVHTGADVAKALELGSEGVLVASAVTRASDPAKALEELLSGYPRTT